MAEAIWIQLAAELHEAKQAYGDRIAVYTDGSVKDKNATCAVQSDNFKLVSRLRKGSSSYNAELNAIYYAISFIKTRPENFVIYSDSLSALTALSCVSDIIYQPNCLQNL